MPEGFVGDAVDRRPRIRRVGIGAPLCAEVSVEKARHRGRNPTGGVNTVGDVTDRDVAIGHARPDVLPHRAADLPVQPAHAVAPLAGAEGEDGHAERLVAVGDILAAEGHEALEVEAEGVVVTAASAAGAKVVLDEGRVEMVDARGHGRVSREHVRGRRGLAGLIEREVGMGSRNGRMRSRRHERGVPFVHVKDGGRAH